MNKTSFEVSVPIPLLHYGIDQNEVSRRVTEWLILSLFTEGHISSGKAAQLLEIERVDFLSLLRARGIAYLNFTPEELAEEIDAAKAIGTQSAS